MRLFIAAKLPLPAIHILKEVQKSIPMGVRATKDMHLTLAFLGEVDNQKPIIDLLEKLSFHSFSSSLSSPGCFPEKGRPHILYISLTNEKDWAALAKRIRELTREIVPVDERFTPHITLGRVKEGMRINTEDWKKTKIEKTEFIVDTVCLYQSTLTSQGPVYNELVCIHLKKQELFNITEKPHDL